jgi:hypothetical protein
MWGVSMTLEAMKRKTLALIEELNLDNENMTDDPDIQGKFNDVTNQVQYELVRYRKLARFVELPVTAGQTVTFRDIGAACGREVFQVDCATGVTYDTRANGTVFRILESGTLEIDCFVFPEPITADTTEDYEFELPADLLEIMPYGIAADLLKSDVSAEYGKIYETRYKEMLQMIDPRSMLAGIRIDGGVRI